VATRKRSSNVADDEPELTTESANADSVDEMLQPGTSTLEP